MSRRISRVGVVSRSKLNDMNMKLNLLKTTIAAALIAVSHAQTPRSQNAETPGLQAPAPKAATTPSAESQLARFDLDFPGGKPNDLVQAIQKKIGVLNAIVPSEHENEVLPPLQMRNVNVKELFQALEMASLRTTTSFDPNTRMTREGQATFGFRASGSVSPETVWYFYAPPARKAPKAVRYYQLSPYLTRYKVDDITTAIQAGWKMSGEKDLPELNFHEDTKLLIAVGDPLMLTTIDSVLQELVKSLELSPKAVPPPVVPQPKPGQK